MRGLPRTQGKLDGVPLLALARSLRVGYSSAEMQALAEHLAALVRDYYVHLPVKRSALAIDPVQELLLLGDDVRFGLDEQTYVERLLMTMRRLRDRHTAVKLPAPWDKATAFLPFVAEACHEGGRQVVIVSKVHPDLDAGPLEPGMEITHWNGVPIAAWIRRLAEQTDGANPWARIALALRLLTVRPLAFQVPPDEDWVTISFESARGSESLVVPWRLVFGPAPTLDDGNRLFGAAALLQGVDRATLAVNDAWRALYAQAAPPGEAEAVPGPVEASMRVLAVGGRSIGYLRIFSFATPDVPAFLNAMEEALKALPGDGLVIDVRANPGGMLPAAEGLLQLLTPRPVVPERLEMRVTTALQQLVMSSPHLGLWRRSMGLRYETGQLFTQGFTMLDPALVAGRQGVYRGPVALVTDALAYSASDFFAAGWQDNGLGPIIGVDPVTGAGGANVWSYAQLRDVIRGAGLPPLAALPRGTDLNLSLRRSTRINFNDNLPLEGLGVAADIPYRLTRADVLGSNDDLLAFAAGVVARL